MKKQKASPEMQKFFEKLIDLKETIYNQLKKNADDPFLQEICRKCDAIIKNGDQPNA